MREFVLNGSWTVCPVASCEEGRAISAGAVPAESLPAQVPGDIHLDLLRAGKIPDPFLGDNLNACKWVSGRNWCYTRVFELPEDFAGPVTQLQCKGIDTFSRIYLNGEEVGETHNMFMRRAFEVGALLQPGKNILCVVLASMQEKIQEQPHEGYSSCFHHERIFIRKPQCHFSWDWSPELLATGIYDDITLTAYEGLPIQSVQVRASNSGDAVFFVDMGETAHTGEPRSIRLTVTGPGFQRQVVTHHVYCRGPKQLILHVDNPCLWWPAGYGGQPLYRYEAELFIPQADGSERRIDCKTGSFAFREIALDESPAASGDALRFALRVNGVPVFLKGANWVPVNIFTGAVGEKEYDERLSLLVEGNMNALRVWGGGLYEKDAFYDLCDQKGILVWQDFMFSCAEMPADHPGFLEEVTEEILQQIRRLRNHPCIAVWCGGNERPGGIQDEPCKGEENFKYLFRGLAGHLDPTRPYVMSSPFSYELPGNNPSSGDVHLSSMTLVMDGHASVFKEKLAQLEVPMMTEIACMGASDVDTIRRYIPDEHLWPPDDVWTLHVRGNPYDGLDENFVVQQIRLASQHFGPVEGLNDYAKKAALLQAEHIKADVEFHRSRAMDCAGALLWMFNDIWPCGSWAIVDYYLNRKAGYYAMKRACQPVLPVVVLRRDGLRAVVINDTGRELEAAVEIQQVHADGRLIRRQAYQVTAAAHRATEFDDLSGFDASLPGTMFFLHMAGSGQAILNSYIPRPFADMPFASTAVEPAALTGEDGRYTLTLRSGTRVARCVYLRARGAEFSDNYIDLPPHTSYTVEVKAAGPLKLEDILVRTFADEWLPLEEENAAAGRPVAV